MAHFKSDRREFMTIEGEILRLEETRIAAVVGRDFATLKRLMAPDCTFVESDGSSRTTAQFIANLRASESRFETFVVHENRVRINGAIAVATGRYENSVRERGELQPVKQARHLRVWARGSNGTWRMIAHQATAISEARAER